MEGLRIAQRVYEDRKAKALELKSQGKRIIGYFCCYFPAEILTAAGVVPFRIMGDIRETVRDSDSCLEPNMCPWVRNCFELLLKGKYDFLDGIVVMHSCDPIERIYGLWRRYAHLPYVYFLELPHILGSSAFKLFSSELYRFKQSIEEFIGEQINDEVLKEAIRLHNQNRALVRQLYELRKPDPPLVTGAEVVRIIGAGLSLPISQFNSLLEEVMSEVSSRQPPQSKPVRLLIYGSVIDNPPFLELVEGYGACAVMDDIAIGSRTFWFEVREDIDPITALSRAYLTGIRCPRTIQGKRKEIRREELLDKFGYLLKYIQDFGVNAVIAYILRFCDIHQFDFPDLAQFIKETVGVPVLYIDDDYTLGSMPRLKTRLEAFIEMVKEGSHGNSASH